jgi:hypothetical protein
MRDRGGQEDDEGGERFVEQKRGRRFMERIKT